MSEMFYEEENFKRPVRATGGGSKMSQWLMDKGIAKSKSAANLVLIGIAVVAVALTIYIMKNDSPSRTQVPTEQQVDFQERRANRLNQ